MKKDFHENQTAITCNSQSILNYADFPQKCVQAVYANLIALISEYAESNCFTEAPDGSEPPFYFRRKIDKIEAMIHQIYNRPELVSKMLEVTTAIKRMICLYDFPGVPISWYEINPNLKYYSAAFKIMLDDPKLYKRMQKGESPLSLEIYPDRSELPLYIEYLSTRNRNNKDNGYRYKENDFFQAELIETVKTIFENIFDEKDE